MFRTVHIGLSVVILVWMMSLFGCDKSSRSHASEADDLKGAIAQTKGAYTWRDDLGRYEYSEKVKLEEILSAKPPEYAVGILIECLDDTSASASVLGGKPVPVGIVCYEALTQLVYYEPTDPSGDVAAHWEGILSPDASPNEMRVAKVVWRKAHEAELLIFQ